MNVDLMYAVPAGGCLALVVATQVVDRLREGGRLVATVRGLTLASYLAAVLAAGHAFNHGWPTGREQSFYCLGACNPNPVSA